ncbi:MAG: SH3 domain-containing protein [Candidatus Moranbacteria bacterium]|nr:SH3 domain-containing protein [Candidatus Moranbacteria bacterium]
MENQNTNQQKNQAKNQKQRVEPKEEEINPQLKKAQSKEAKKARKKIEQLEAKEKEAEKEKIKPVVQLTIGLTEKKEYFVENLAMLLNSGMSIFRALNSLEKDTRSKRMKKIIGSIKSDVAKGLTLSHSLRRTGIFSKYVTALIKIGEESGHLADNLEVIAKQQKKERMFRSKLQTAMMYPVFVFGLTFVVGIGIAWFVLPRLTTVFGQLNVELPLVTKIIIGFGDFMKFHGLQVVPLFVIFIAILIFLFFINPKTKFIGQAITFKIPGLKTLIQEAELARMGYVLGTLLTAGIPIVTALKSMANTTTTLMYKKFFNYLSENIKVGGSFETSFKDYKKSRKLIPIPVQQMIIASEQSGRLASVMLTIGEMYEEKNEDSTKRLATMIEPILLFIIWVGVVFVAMAIILPIYSLVGNFQRGTSASSSDSQPAASAPVAQINPDESEKNPADKSAGNPDIEDIKMLKSSEDFNVNIREEPGEQFPVIRQAKKGEIFEFNEKKDDWYNVQLDEENSGWMQESYVIELTPQEIKSELEKRAEENVEETSDEAPQEEINQ